MSLNKFGWRVGLYTEQQSRDKATVNGLSRAKTVKENLMLLEFWPNIRDGGFNGEKKAPIESLRWTSTIFIASTPMRSFTTSPIGSLSEMMNALSVEPPPHVFKKKPLITMGVIIELHSRGVTGLQHGPWSRKMMREIMRATRQLEGTQDMRELEAPSTYTVT
ncbi:hypothetical protein Tco_1013526 [Tanacetum coccineum]